MQIGNWLLNELKKLISTSLMFLNHSRGSTNFHVMIAAIWSYNFWPNATVFFAKRRR